MSQSKQLIPNLNYRDCAQAVAACIRAKQTALIIGSPGGGKTSLVRAAARTIRRRCVDMIASNMDPTDVAGLPYRGADGRVHRELFPEIQAAVDEPCVLFLDEATTMPKSVEGPMLRLALERNAGGTPLNEESAVVLACNPPEMAPGGIELSAALINRVVLLRYQPNPDEIREFFNGRPTSADGSVIEPEKFEDAYRLEALDFAATLAHDPTLVTYDPPRESIDAGAPWASPRAWEIGLRCLAAHFGKEDSVGYALLAGIVGPHAANAYLSIRRLRNKLPSVDQIVADPYEARVPKEPDYQIAALGVLARVADKDTHAAWIYTGRMSQIEIAAAAARVLLNKPVKGQMRLARDGNNAQIDLLAKIKRASN